MSDHADLNTELILDTEHTPHWSRCFHIPNALSVTQCVERVHLSLWLAKDLAWVQEWYAEGLAFGVAAVAWTCGILLRSVYFRNHVETWHEVSHLLWLVANFWWMWGELHDVNRPSEPEMYEANRSQSQIVMLVALVWIGAYYGLLWPLGLFPVVAPEALAPYCYEGRRRWPLASWRAYESVHMLFWIGKDVAWIYELPALWYPNALITALMAIDLAVSGSTHYVAQAFWVLSNLIMSFFELFLPEDGTVYPLLPPMLPSPRWWAAWALVAALVVVATGALKHGWFFCVLQWSSNRQDLDEQVLFECGQPAHPCGSQWWRSACAPQTWVECHGDGQAPVRIDDSASPALEANDGIACKM
jgi:hypothetical protein